MSSRTDLSEVTPACTYPEIIRAGTAIGSRAVRASEDQGVTRVGVELVATVVAVWVRR